MRTHIAHEAIFKAAAAAECGKSVDMQDNWQREGKQSHISKGAIL
jgi:hypothetical protein